MNRYELGVRTSNVTTNQAVCEIIAPPVASGFRGVRILNFNITLATGVTGVFGVGRPAAAGVTPTSPVAFLSDENGDPSQTKIALAWATSPTSPAAFFNRCTMPATVGAIRDIVIPPPIANSGAGIWVPAGSTLVLFNITGGPTLDLSMSILEP